MRAGQSGEIADDAGRREGWFCQCGAINTDNYPSKTRSLLLASLSCSLLPAHVARSAFPGNDYAGIEAEKGRLCTEEGQKALLKSAFPSLLLDV